MIEIRCERCLEEAEVDWVDTTTFADPPSRMPGAMRCRTPGCVDETGSSATSPVPSPEQLLARAARWWDEKQAELGGQR